MRQSVVAAAWRYKFLVGGLVVASAVLALAYSFARPARVVAVASVVLAEPNEGNFGVFETRSTDRRVANELEIFQSAAVARQAAELARAEGVNVTIRDVLTAVAASNIRNTDVITVSTAGTDARTVEVLANSMLTAYQDVRLQQRRSDVARVVGLLNAAEDILTRDLDSVTASIAELRATRDLSTQIDLTLDKLTQVGRALNDETTGETEAADLRQEQDRLVAQLSALRIAFDTESEKPELRALVQKQEGILDQLADLASRRSNVEIETEAAGTGISFVSPPTLTETTTGGGGPFIAVAGAFLGLLIGTGIAYTLDNLNRRIADRFEPETIWGMTFLGDVPDFTDESLESVIPVRDSPRSASAEAFRFGASSVELKADRAEVSTLAVVSATVGAGKSTVVANLAFAAARSGRRVLVLDADFGNQSVSQILLGSIRRDTGIVEVLYGRSDIRSAVKRIDVPGGFTLGLLSRGNHPGSAMDVFGSKRFESVMGELAAEFELVFIDCPPMVQVAYASNLVSVSQAAVVVVEKGASYRSIDDLQRRLDLIETPILGYIFNKAPMRPEMLQSGGSMKDILGDAGFVEPVPSRRGLPRG